MYVDNPVSFAYPELAKNTRATLCLMLDNWVMALIARVQRVMTSLMWSALWLHNSNLVVFAMGS